MTRLHEFTEKSLALPNPNITPVSCEDEGYCPATYKTGHVDADYFDVSFAEAVSQLQADYESPEPSYSTDDGLYYWLYVANYTYFERLHTLCSDRTVFKGWYLDPSEFAFLTNRPSIQMPEVCAYMKKDVWFDGYMPPQNLAVPQKIYYCCSVGYASQTSRIYCWENPFADSTENVFPLAYAGLSGGFYEDASYQEWGEYVLLYKWCFADPPALPNSPPLETPDTEVDDIIETMPVENIPGHETGCFVFTHQDENPNIFLPLSERLPWSGDNFIHAYLTQCPKGFLPYHMSESHCRRYCSSQTIADKFGFSLSYSLNTRIGEIGITSNDYGHVKQVMIIRPRGQVVIFNFPWEGNRFSSKGYPTGINKDLGYVLWCEGDKVDVSEEEYISYRGEQYYLVFSSGVVHQFQVQNGQLSYIYDARNGTYDARTVSPPDLLMTENNETYIESTSGVYRVALKMDNGVPVSVEYRHTGTGNLLEKLNIAYENGVAVRLEKQENNESGSEVRSDKTIHYNSGYVCERTQTGTRQEGRTVTLSEKPDFGSSLQWSDARSYDERLRLVRIVKEKGTGCPIQSSYTYCEESETDQRTPKTGVLVRRLIQSECSGTSFGSNQKTFSYSPDEGWIKEVCQPIGHNEAIKYHYDYEECAFITTNIVTMNTVWTTPVCSAHIKTRKTIINSDEMRKELIQNQKYQTSNEICSTPQAGWGYKNNIGVITLS